MITAEQFKQFLLVSVVPLVTGGLVTWLSGTSVLSIFHINATSAAAIIGSVLVFAVTVAVTWLASHHVLKQTYPPKAAK